MTSPNQLKSPLYLKALAPISASTPVGKDLRAANDAGYYRLQTRRKDEDARDRATKDGYRGKGDWAVVKKEAEALLTQSKDLEVAFCLTAAMTRLQGCEGLNTGMQLMLGLYQQYGDALHPISRAAMGACFANLESLRIPLSASPLTSDQEERWFSLLDWQEAQDIERMGDAKARDARLKAGAPTPGMFQAAATRSGPEFYANLGLHLDGILRAVDRVESLLSGPLCDEDDEPATLSRLRDTTTACLDLIARWRPEPPPEPPSEVVYSPDDAKDQDSTQADSIQASEADAVPTLEFPPMDLDDFLDVPGAESGASAPHLGQNLGQSSGGPDRPASEKKAAPAGPVEKGLASASVLPSTLRSLSEVPGLIEQVCHFVRRKDPLHPWSFLLARALRWGELYHQAQSLENQLEPPSTEVRRQLKRLETSHAWKDLLLLAEDVGSQPAGRGWLDLQRLSWEALVHLGGRYESLANLLAAELGVLLRQQPTLMTAELLDGTPAVGLQTRAWLLEERIASPEGQESVPSADDGVPVTPAGAGSARPSRKREKPTPSVLEQAVALQQAGKVIEGLELLRGAVQQAGSRRERFLRQLEIAEYCLAARRFDLTRPILGELGTIAEQKGLEEWEEQAISVRLWSALYRMQTEDPEATADAKTKSKVIFEKLCKADAAHAARLVKS